MIKLNDHYFIAWLKVVKKYEVFIDETGIYVKMTPEQYSKALVDYENTYKDILKEIRSFIKHLNISTSKFKN